LRLPIICACLSYDISKWATTGEGRPLGSEVPSFSLSSTQRPDDS